MINTNIDATILFDGYHDGNNLGEPETKWENKIGMCE